MEEKSFPFDQDILARKAAGPHGDIDVWIPLSEEDQVIEKKLRRKIDILILPLLTLVLIMNFIDRNNYAAARLQGLEQDLNLVGDQYQVGLSILFVGYVSMQVPSNLMLNYCGRPSLYLGSFVVAWGLVSALTSQVRNYSQIVVCRFLLGVVEAPFFPGVLFYLSKWYTKEELSLRMAVFLFGALASGAFGSLIAAGILSGLAGARGMSAWQWLYIIEGSVTVFIGLIITIILPDFPETWRGLSPEMKRVATTRMELDAGEADIDGANMNQIQGLKLALKDPVTYLLAVAYTGMTGAAGFQQFFPTLAVTLGYSHTITLLLVAPPYIFMIFWSIPHSLLSDRLGNRFWFFIYPIPLAITGFIIFMTTDGFGPRYFSFFLMIIHLVMTITCYSWVSNAIPRPPAKRAAAIGLINSFGNSASIWTPYLYYKSEAPYYRTALGVDIALLVLAGAMGIILRFYLQAQNKKLDRLEAEDVQATEKEVDVLQKRANSNEIDIARLRGKQRGHRFLI